MFLCTIGTRKKRVPEAKDVHVLTVKASKLVYFWILCGYNPSAVRIHAERQEAGSLYALQRRCRVFQLLLIELKVNEMWNSWKALKGTAVCSKSFFFFCCSKQIVRSDRRWFSFFLLNLFPEMTASELVSKKRCFMWNLRTGAGITVQEKQMTNYLFASEGTCSILLGRIESGIVVDHVPFTNQVRYSTSTIVCLACSCCVFLVFSNPVHWSGSWKCDANTSINQMWSISQEISRLQDVLCHEKKTFQFCLEENPDELFKWEANGWNASLQSSVQLVFSCSVWCEARIDVNWIFMPFGTQMPISRPD